MSPDRSILLIKNTQWLVPLILLACSSLPDKEGTIKLIPTKEGTHVDVEAQVNGQPLVFRLDTGTQENLINTESGLSDLIAKGTTTSQYNFIGKKSAIKFNATIKVNDLEEQMMSFNYSPEHITNFLSTKSYLSKRILFNFKNNFIHIGGNHQPCLPNQKFRVLGC